MKRQLLDPIALDRTLTTMSQRLLESRNPAGVWEGRLASSALSTATAVMALVLSNRSGGASREALIRAGLDWLITNQNPDGGWGDTVVSFSNLSTSVLCWSALSAGSTYHAKATQTVAGVERWLGAQIGSLNPEHLRRTILDRYGKDRTFSVPILTVLALAGKLGPPGKAWRNVPQLPFELAAFPHQWFNKLRLPVVSYALPALVAIGQVRHRLAPSRNPLSRALRKQLESLTLRKALEMQPSSGGFLEAVPLTAFVTMSLIEAGHHSHPIVANGVRFLQDSVRSDGSWPIDSNLSTWVTTLSINALSEGGFALTHETRKLMLRFLLDQQLKDEHPFTHAQAGGWAWTDLSGGVPDADDTSGALLALRNLAGSEQHVAARAGIRWLLDLQNSDGGIPTFCKGWGALPFDQSAPDLTAHALEAWSAWYSVLDTELTGRIDLAAKRAMSYLERCQREDGSWIPLWFGNQHAPNELNCTYGTARVISALTTAILRNVPQARDAGRRGLNWLLRAQREDGGWSGADQGPPSIEETALALGAIAACENEPDVLPAIERGVHWLIHATDEGRKTPPSPIGLYFARLWYYEELYPLVFALHGLSRARARIAASRESHETPSAAARGKFD